MSRATPILGFKPPHAKNGEIVLPVLTGSGDWSELHATPATWQRIGLALALHWTPPSAAEPAASNKEQGASAKRPVLKPSGRLL